VDTPSLAFDEHRNMIEAFVRASDMGRPVCDRLGCRTAVEHAAHVDPETPA
jgi:hypothetical protein